MIKRQWFKQFILTIAVFFSMTACQSAEKAPTPSPSNPIEQAPLLKNIRFTGASVLPYTEWSSKPKIKFLKPGVKYFLLSREAYGSAAGMWDDWGGSKDDGETDPTMTAAREFTEESMMLFQDVSNYEAIGVRSPKNKAIIVSKRKKTVVYVIQLDPVLTERFSKEFYRKRTELLKKNTGDENAKYLEKNAIGWISEHDLKQAILKAPRDAAGRLIKPIDAKVYVLHASGKVTYQTVPLRPILVSKLQSYVKGKPFVPGEDPKIRFYP